jgi:AraC family transcriptional regulator
MGVGRQNAESVVLCTSADAGVDGVSPTERNVTVNLKPFEDIHQANATSSSAAAASSFQSFAKGLVNLLETARRELDSDREAAKASLVAASHILQAEIERCAGTNGSVRGGLATWQILRVRAYVDNNLQRTIHIRDLSAVARRSPAHFSRKFKMAVGESPHAYVVRRRLEKACHLMMTGSASLSEIALSVGFADQAHLCRLFRQAFGQSPAIWRRECGIPDEVTPGRGLDENVHERPARQSTRQSGRVAA